MPGHLWHVPTASNAASNAAAAAATLAKPPATALASATANSAPAKPTAPNRTPGFAPSNDLPRHLRHRRRWGLPGRWLGRLRVDVRVRDRLQ